jgi:O-antigen/teichoic acid export membrane protein
MTQSGRESIEPSPLGKRIWRGAAWVVVGRTLGILATVILSVTAPRLLAPSDYAAFTLVSSVIIFAGGLAMFGLNGAMVRFLAERLGQRDLAGARMTLRAGWRLAAAAIGIVAALTGVYLMVGGLRWFQLAFDPMVVLFACVALALLACQQLAAESLRGFHDLKLASVLSGGQLGGPITTFLFLAGLLAVAGFAPSDSLTLRVALGLLVVALLVTTPIALASLRRIARRTFVETPSDAGPLAIHAEVNKLIPVCVPLMIMGGLSFAATQADLWIAGTLATGNDVALYAAARRLVVMVAMPLQMVNLTIMASVPSLYFQGKKADLQRLLRLSAWIAAAPALVCLTIIFFQPAQVLGLFFKAYYRGAAGYLAVLAVGQLGLVLAGSCGITLAMTGHHKTALRISLLSAALLAVAGPLATYRFGLSGLTFVSVAATLIECGLQWYFTKQLVGVWTHCALLTALPELRRWLATWRERRPSGVASNSPEPISNSDVPQELKTQHSVLPRPSASMLQSDPPEFRPSRGLWWLHPSWAFGLLNGITLFIALLLSEEAFRLYGTPKYMNLDYFLLGLLGIAAFAAGQWLAKSSGAAPQPMTSDHRRRLYPWFTAAIALSIIGYAVWFGGGLLRARSLAPLTAVWDVGDQTETDVRGELFPTIPGVTTLTQLGMAAIVLGLLLPVTTRAAKIRRRLLIAALISLAAMRMILVSERLAIIELVIPAVVLGLRLTFLARLSISPQTMRRLRLAPMLAVAGVALLFGGAEYFRSWRFYQDRFDSFAEFTIWRLSGYYTTAHNNGAMAMTVRGPWPTPYYTLEQFWRFPLVVGSPISYAAVNGFDPDDQHMATLERFGTPELNNEGGLFAPAMDFGWFGFVVFWIAFGFLAGRLHRGFLIGSLAGLLFYPLLFIALLEAPLLLYLSSVRSFPAIVLLLILIGWERRRDRRPATVYHADQFAGSLTVAHAMGGAS